MKPVHWLGDSRDRLRDAPVEIRVDAGYQLERVQAGESPIDFRPMPDVGPGTIEIRVHGKAEYRIFYVAQHGEAVYVLHCFSKKTRATRKTDIDLGKQRYRLMLEIRKTEVAE